MIIVLGSQKGGVGKSTLAVSIAAGLLSRGYRVLIVDADDQKSVLTWYNNRPESLPHIPVTGASGNIKAMLKEHAKSYDFIIADCAGRDSAEMRSGLMAADVFISPLRPSQMDLDVVPHTCSVFTAAKDFNEDVKGYLVLNMTPTNMFVNEGNEAAQVLEDFPQMKLADTRICDRKAHRDAWAESMTIYETENRKAKDEVERLIQEVIL
ncbi:Chromosome partitioning protein ParA [Pantoea sp. AS-PWVM4]|uniref:Cobyrinic acid ac-diamide synthase n=1 Tax=Pantoea phytobeneficialis TaxID=2052056 RepID=A0AAP9HAI0_9GAMM|nr:MULTISPECIES: ParA family plasmid-partitioning AAA ATPase [Pantoea]ERK09432.1 Chromosome partitioning protein ParA [Pantoea sp. AS-PWVM4]MDO6407433.1 ParA family plasmid-partitioning AAA ATPase [Pantoea phytobeneficialis]QGR09516.1 cobyrinic acid ac-diamide synthase [Pantoea phytobeneficialis]